MISRIHNKLGTAGLVVAIVALVAALTGAAYAAQGLNSKQKKEVKKIAKKFAGKPGPVGPAGPQGPAGPAGKDGANGTNGTNGKSVVLGTATVGQCPDGGSTVEVEGSGTKKSICNGETGFTATLPSGETETGTWSLGPSDGAALVPLAFNIPLDEAPEALHFVNLEGKEKTGESPTAVDPPVNCTGSAEEPTAAPGHVCVYEGANFGEATGFSGNGTIEALYTSGATFFYIIAEGQVVHGTWAVTAK